MYYALLFKNVTIIFPFYRKTFKNITFYTIKFDIIGRIDNEYCLVKKVNGQGLFIVSCRYHYSKSYFSNYLNDTLLKEMLHLAIFVKWGFFHFLPNH